MKHWRAYTDSKTLGVGDLPDAAADLIVRIVRVEAGSVKYADGAQKKPLIHLQGFAKPLAAGAKVCKAIASLHTAFPDAWHGKTIAIYATTDRFAGETVDAIRVRLAKPADNARAYGDPEQGGAQPFDLDGTLSEIADCATREDVEALALSIKATVPKPQRDKVKAALDAKRATFAAESTP